MLINADIAKKWSETDDSRSMVELKSVVAAIYKAIADGVYHCEWYSTAGLDGDDFSINNIIIPFLKERGYYITREDIGIKPEDKFTHSRIKLHINWEADNSSEKA